ncbi:hypothetical protein FM119_05530 [Mycetocola reblochoni REB411]|uniref:DUF3099 domain-containing protein n=2 Tax=Mycetocola reblochoni TaxID=331618 RepID=A0A1R4J5H7_9MICO|nr:hypothetical protein FM119_05530 [Mycetocola reblochoni REB411]
MRTYSIMMAIRLVCLFALLFVRGWWVWICVAGAVFLPYIAVMLANATASPVGSEVDTPGSIVRAGAGAGAETGLGDDGPGSDGAAADPAGQAPSPDDGASSGDGPHGTPGERGRS